MDITGEEEKGVAELCKRVEHEMSPELLKDSTVYIRFLRARECNIDKATEMLRNHIEWRKRNDIDNIQNYKFPEVLGFLPYTFLGFDKSGATLHFNDLGNFDVRGMLKSVKKEDLVNYIVKIMESDAVRLREQSEKLGKTVDKWLYISNFENFSLTSATNKRILQFYIHLVKTYEANYPERLKAMYIINASSYFTLAFKVIKPLLTATTLKKVVIFGKDGWKEELPKLANPEVLPVFLGGTRKDESGDPLCSAFVKHGCPIPQSHFFRSAERRLCGHPDINKLTLSRMSKKSVELDVKRAGDFIEWEFETESGDIAFGLFMEVNQSENYNLKEIIPVQRVEAHIAYETGTYRCEEPGKYVLQFDNSYSWIKRKDIFYRIEVIENHQSNSSNNVSQI